MGDSSEMQRLSEARALELKRIISMMGELITEHSENFRTKILKGEMITVAQYFEWMKAKGNGENKPFEVYISRLSNTKCPKILLGDNNCPEGRILNRNAIFYINSWGKSEEGIK